MIRTLLLALAVVVVAQPAAQALPSPQEVAKNLDTLQTSQDSKARAAALLELAKAGQVNKRLIKDAEPAMVKALEDKDDAVRAAAAKAIGMIALEPKKYVLKLLEMVEKDKAEEVKVGAIEGLAAMGKEAKPVLPKLVKLLEGAERPSKVGRAGRVAMRTIKMSK